MNRSGYQSFGNLDRRPRPVLDPDEATAMLRKGVAEPGSLLAFGNGRSYGDSCQNRRGWLIDMRSCNRILAFDPESGLLDAEAGALLSDIIDHVAPTGYFPPVVPGTRFVTLGGAIANDIHGKNHHRRGTFGCHVEELTLLRSDGSERICSPVADRTLFEASIGGMGLTGLITRAKLRLMRVPSLTIREAVRPLSTLAEYFEVAQAVDRDNEYAVAWIDQLAPGSACGRGVLITGNHTDEPAVEPRSNAGGLSVPFELPFGLVNTTFVRLFNFTYRAAKLRSRLPRLSNHKSFFFPLDGISNWNRLYGAAGLYQHQSVLPEEDALQAVSDLLRIAREAGQASFLTVLKRFGKRPSPGLMSFPRPGYTLTLDFPNRGTATLALLKKLDEITIAAGGAVNPYKDARMDPHTFAASFPKWTELEAARDPAFMSDFWARTAMRLASRPLPVAAE